MPDTNTVVAAEEHSPLAQTTELPPTTDSRSRTPSPIIPEEITVEPTTTAPLDSPADPRVVAIRALFPDYDDTILQSVLESVDWNQDRAVDTLLIMSDPEYKPEPALPQRPQRRHTAPVLTQEQLDEQFARQLVMQDQQQWAAGRMQGPPGSYPSQPGAFAQHPGQYPQQQIPQGQGQGIAEFQDQFNKFAETGKKTIGSFLTKVKTKFQEFEQGRPSGPSTNQYPSQQWAPGPASYYGPPLSQPNQPPQGYQYAGQSSPGSAPLPPSKSPSPPITLSPAPTSVPTSTVPPPLTSPAPPIDGVKLGLLPKRPISLVKDDDPTVAGKNTAIGASGSATTGKGYTVDDDDDDGLEYAENPFDDHRK